MKEPQWTVDKKGWITGKGYYHIDPDRLGEPWLLMLSEKSWVDMNQFITAYIKACGIVGVKSVSIKHGHVG